MPMTVRFSNQLVAELIQQFWTAWHAGEFMTDASALAGTYHNRGLARVRQAGGVGPPGGAPRRGVTCVDRLDPRWACLHRDRGLSPPGG